MSNFNNVVLLGNLVANPELVSVGSSQVAKFRLAVSRKFTTKEGEKRDDTLYIDCEMWGVRASALEKYVSKGDPILVHGYLKQDSWQTKEGQSRTKILVSVQDFEFISTRGRSENQEAPQARQYANAQSLDEQDIPF